MKILLLIVSAGLFPFSFFAQRNVDLELTVTSPQDGEYIPPIQFFPFTVSVKNVTNANKSIDCLSLANEMYQLEIKTSNEIAIKKLVINNP